MRLSPVKQVSTVFISAVGAADDRIHRGKTVLPGGFPERGLRRFIERRAVARALRKGDGGLLRIRRGRRRDRRLLIP